MPVVTPTIPELFEEAYERAGLQLRSGYDLRSIRRSLNLIQLEWQNRGLNLFTMDEGVQALTAGTNEYTMPTDTIDLIEHQLRTGTGTSQVDQHLERISLSNWAKQSAKNSTGRPSQIWVDRQATGVTVTLWPVPDSSSYSLYYVRLRGIDGLSSGIGTAPSIPPRFVPALVAGLAFHTAMKHPEKQAIAPALKQEYIEAYNLAAEEDRDRATFRIQPMVF